MKWKLRTMFIVITLVAIVVWSVNQRYQLLNTTMRIQDSGGEIVYQWQQPSVVADMFVILPAYPFSPRRQLRTAPDGTTWTETFSSSLDSTTGLPFSTNTIGHSVKTKPASGPLAALWDVNHDIAIAAVVVDEDKVDADFVAALAELTDLKIVQIRRNSRYFKLKVCRATVNVVSQETLKTELAKFNEPFVKASALICQRLPKVRIIEGKMK